MTKWNDYDREFLYDCCHRAAREHAAKCGLAADVAEDMGSAAFAKALETLDAQTPDDAKEAFLRVFAASRVMNAFNTLSTKRERLLSGEAVRLDWQDTTEDEPDDGDMREAPGTIIGDHGEQAAAMQAFDDPPVPEWVYGVRYERLCLRGMEARVAKTFAERSMTYSVVRETLDIGRRVFEGVLKKLKVRFAQCLRAYHAWKRETGCTHF